MCIIDNIIINYGQALVNLSVSALSVYSCIKNISNIFYILHIKLNDVIFLLYMILVYTLILYFNMNYNNVIFANFQLDLQTLF